MVDMLIEEVNEDLRRDRWHQFFQRIKWPLIAVVSLLIFVTAGASIYRHYDIQHKHAATASLLKAVALYESQNYAQAATAFVSTQKLASGELADVSALWQARSFLGDAKIAEATKILTHLVQNRSTASRVRDMACIHLYALPGDIQKACYGAQKSALQPSLKLLYAAHLWQTGEQAQAGILLSAMANNADMPADLRDIAARYASTIQANGK
jgi:hypothetical protein